MMTAILLTLFWADPTLTLDTNQQLKLGLPVSLLEEPALADNLQSGLTTILRVTCKDKRGGAEYSFQLAIRFDLWDEQFLIAESDVAGDVNRHTAAGSDGLTAWWRDQRFVITQVRPAMRGVWQVTAEVLPFSAGEQRQTQAWLARTTSEATSDSSSGSTSGGVLEAIVTTSIKRRPLQRFRWDVQVQEP